MKCTMRDAFVALIWASAALATPLMAERMSSDLEARQSSNGKCPASYTTRNGMSLTTYCNTNNPFNDALDPFSVNSMQECMERCSRYWGDGEGCFGVVWRESDGNCWMRNSTTGTANMVSNDGIHAALVNQGEMSELDTDCPETDLSTHTLNGTDGIGYTVHCGKVIGQFDTCWEGYPSCLQSPFIGYYHATSLEQCLQFCVDEHPLCRAVSYNPGLEIGFANCWPKTGAGNTLDNPTTNMGILHSAVITSLNRIDSTCPENDKYTASDNKEFEVHCGQLNTGTNITSVHRQNITSCMDACASSDQNCVGIVFDSSLSGGYNNCYLQNTTSVISDRASATYALLTGTTIPTASTTPSGNSGTNPPGGSDGDSDSSSQAWIAGPVIGGVAAIAIIAGALFWWRRRKNKQSPATVEKDGNTYAQAPAYGDQGALQNQYYNNAPSELGGDHARELATVEYKPTTKYAAHAREQSGAVPTHAPQELP
ncbi:hypothetical protein BS50DRAFT_327832 [Corynespora cassiicola Philippines]|uniref:Apple domain-containing protein n=1 Tax=Corynespora cassiicola Philippines TaxID=1448308 RepID=A0A2T2NU07_CORCC|nr:hypothetical protein BS50DRAFT_327832 [Corynespora cassiicola Philippines]